MSQVAEGAMRGMNREVALLLECAGSARRRQEQLAAAGETEAAKACGLRVREWEKLAEEAMTRALQGE